MTAHDFMKYKDMVTLLRDSGFKVKEVMIGNAIAATVPELGDRVAAISWAGKDGINPLFGQEFDITGGEGSQELIFRYAFGIRDWVGPEGAGDYSFFHKELPLTFEGNWFVPEALNIPKMVSTEGCNQHVQRSMNDHATLYNLKGNEFKIGFGKQTNIIGSASRLWFLDGLDLEGVDVTGVRRRTTFSNEGENAWNEGYGMPFIWTLAMIGSDEGTKLFVPYSGGEVVDYEFDDGKPIPPEMRKSYEGVDVITANGMQRYKIGLAPEHALGMAASYIPSLDCVALLVYQVASAGNYIDGRWTDTPIITGGHCLNAYNNLGNNPQLPGYFHELEATSPRLELAPEESDHLDTCLVFLHGPIDKLEKVVQKTVRSDQVTLK